MPRQSPVILLIDDDLDFIEMNRVLLESRGYRVLVSQDPQDAWEKINQEKPALIITDLMMQSLDSGFSLSRQIKQDPRFQDIPIIILTSVNSMYGFDFHPRSSEELSAMYADAFFEKPITPKLILQKIEDLIARYSNTDRP